MFTRSVFSAEPTIAPLRIAKEQGIFTKYGLDVLMAQHGLNPKAAQIKPEEVADMSYCKRFEDSGFFRSLY